VGLGVRCSWVDTEMVGNSVSNYEIVEPLGMVGLCILLLIPRRNRAITIEVSDPQVTERREGV
jgi:hypothetical protein